MTRHAFTRRTFLRSAGAGAGGLALAGCLGGGGGGGGTVTIGLQAALTGPLSAWGTWHDRIVRRYVDILNEDGGIDGMEVELSVEDEQSDPKAGVESLRKLVDRDGADFVIGAHNSGSANACAPVAKETRTPYFTPAKGVTQTGSNGNRWVLRNYFESLQFTYHAVNWGLENLGPKWTVIYQDYAYGQEQRDALQRWMDEFGGDDGEVLDDIAVPMAESDLTSQLNNVPDETDVLYNVLVPPSSLGFLRQVEDLNTPGTPLGDSSSLDPLTPSDLTYLSEGVLYLTGMPNNIESDALSSEIRDANAYFRDEVVEVDAAGDLGGFPAGSSWDVYESVSWIKRAIEGMGWESRDDHEAFIEWFEADPAVSTSREFPQGDKFFRGVEHQAYVNHYVEEIRDGESIVRDMIEVTQPFTGFPPRADFTTQSF